MDLSGIIFVALAIAWAVYLIPKALQHHDEIARSRGVDRFSARMRVFGGTPDAAELAGAPVEMPSPVEPVVVARTVTREAARRAAARRRKVLYVLAALTLISVLAGWRGYAPVWTVVVPVALVVGFLAIARRTVRREQVRQVVVTPRVAADDAPAEPTDREDTLGLSRAELAEPDALPLEDEGSLWDPLPVTLPTYVSKPVARRTVRTIELTHSSGHDPLDSALVRQAEAAQEPPEALEGRAAGA